MIWAAEDEAQSVSGERKRREGKQGLRRARKRRGAVCYPRRPPGRFFAEGSYEHTRCYHKSKQKSTASNWLEYSKVLATRLKRGLEELKQADRAVISRRVRAQLRRRRGRREEASREKVEGSGGSETGRLFYCLKAKTVMESRGEPG